MTIPQLLWALFIYIGLGGIVVGYAACVMAGRSDDTAVDEAGSVELEAVTYTLHSVQDEHLALS